MWEEVLITVPSGSRAVRLAYRRFRVLADVGIVVPGCFGLKMMGKSFPSRSSRFLRINDCGRLHALAENGLEVVDYRVDGKFHLLGVWGWAPSPLVIAIHAI
jgi:hypothetical protein